MARFRCCSLGTDLLSSGVAVIYLIILFSTDENVKTTEGEVALRISTLSGASTPFVACVGVNDLDGGLAITLVSIVMLGALPAAA